MAEILEGGKEATDEFMGALTLKRMQSTRLAKELERLLEEDEDDVAAAPMASGDKFAVLTLVFGAAQEAAGGIEAMLGLSMEKRIVGEQSGLDSIREEIENAGSDEDKDNLKYILEGVAQENLPAHVIEDYKRGRYHGGIIKEGEYDEDHRGMTFEDFMQHENVVLSRLSEMELASIRLYTTNTYPLFNGPLRRKQKPHPIAMCVFFLVSGLKKLRAVAASSPNFAEETVLWRGMRDAQVDEKEFKAKGGTEMAAMSTTDSMDVALSYSASKKPLLFKYVTSGLTKGVSIGFLSVYPKEKEFLYPPGTFLRPRKRPYKQQGRKIIEVEPQIP